MSDKWRSILADEGGSSASDPAGLAVSSEKLRELRPELFGFWSAFDRLFVWLGRQDDELRFLKEFLKNGDSRAAVVVSIAPLLVAAYSDELDAIALLYFPDDLAQRYRLAVGMRLLTVNCYLPAGVSPSDDLYPGPRNTGNWANMIPTIAEFVSDDLARIEQLKRRISEEEWKRAHAMGVQYLRSRPGIWRDGRPYLSAMKLAQAVEYQHAVKHAQRRRMVLAGGCATILVACLVCCGAGWSFVSALRRAPIPMAKINVPRAAAQPPPAPPNLAPPAAPNFPAPGQAFRQRSGQPPAGPRKDLFGDAPGTPVDDTTPLPVGTEVYARWAGRWLPGTVAGQRGLTLVVVKLDNSEVNKTAQLPLPRSMVRLRTGDSATSSKPR